MKFLKRQKKTLATAKNNAVATYKRSALFLLWIAILSFVGNFVGIFQNPPYFSLGLASESIIFWNFIGKVDTWLIISIVLGLSFIMSALFIILAVFAHRAKIVVFITGIALYLIDFMLIFTPLYNVVQETGANNFLSIFIHAFCLVFMFIGVYNYFIVLSIHKQMVEQKEKDATLEQNNE